LEEDEEIMGSSDSDFGVFVASLFRQLTVEIPKML
jgi:hypothetical protein